MSTSETRCWLLHLSKDSWQLTNGELGVNGNLEGSIESQSFLPANLVGQADAIAEVMSEHDAGSEPLVIGLDSHWCLAATVPLPSPQLARRREAMRYHLEEWIPWSAEDYVVDYAGLNRQAFMTAVSIEPIRSFLLALEERDVRIALLCPTALLACEEFLVATENIPSRFLLGVHNDDSMDLIGITDRRIDSWRHTPDSCHELMNQRHIETLAHECDEPLEYLEMRLMTSDDVLGDGGLDEPVSNQKLLDHAHRFARRIVDGTQEPQIDLRRNELSGQYRLQRFSKETRRLQLAMCLLLVSITIGAWLRGNSYHEATVLVEQDLKQVHQQLFPGEVAPERIVTKVDQESRRLQATREVDVDITPSRGADLLLQQVIAAIPDELRFRLPEIHVEGERISLGGEVRSNSDADKIAVSLRKHGFIVEAPRIQRLAEKGFSFRLTVRVDDSPSTTAMAN